MISHLTIDNKLKIIILSEVKKSTLCSWLMGCALFMGILSLGIIPVIVLIFKFNIKAGDAGLILALFGGPVMIIVFGEILLAMVAYINLSEIWVTPTTLTVETGPLSWPRKKQFELVQLKQLSIDKNAGIRVITKDRKQLELLGGLSLAKATEVVYLIEDFLKNRPSTAVQLAPHSRQVPNLTGESVAAGRQGNTLTITARWRGRGNMIEPLLTTTNFVMMFSGSAYGVYSIWQSQFESGWDMLIGIVLSLSFGGGVFAAGFISYQSLSTYLNASVIRVDPQTVSIKHGPLPFPFSRNQRFNRADISRFYIEKNEYSCKKSKIYSGYELYLITDTGSHSLLDMKEPGQVMRLKKKLDQYLNLRDQAVAGEDGPLSSPDRELSFVSWKEIALVHNLDFVDLVAKARVAGLYRGYRLALEPDYSAPRTLSTCLTLTAPKPVWPLKPLGRTLTKQDVAQLLSPSGSGFEISGRLHGWRSGRRVVYEQKSIVTDPAYLHFLFDKFCDLLDAALHLVALGGEAVPALAAIANQKQHPLEPVARQTLQEIDQDTSRRLGPHLASLLCPSCLVHFASHTVSIRTHKINYYGCRNCGQSRKTLEMKERTTAVLDHQMAAETLVDEVGLRVNWLLRRTLFDFDRIEIIDASDEDVERFVMQVGNDTDAVRRPRYKAMPCTVSPVCRLSENTRRLLGRAFTDPEEKSELNA